MAQAKRLIVKLTEEKKKLENEKKILQTALSYALEQRGGKAKMPVDYAPKGIMIHPPDDADEVLVEIKEEENDQ